MESSKKVKISRELASKIEPLEWFNGDIKNLTREYHGESKRGNWTPEYFTWRNMFSRCYSTNKNEKSYKNYSSRGIRVCNRWLMFSNFLEDMGRKPFKDASIDRIELDSGYSPINCRWATKREQVRMTRQNVFIVVNGERMILRDAAEKYGIHETTLAYRLKGGMSPDEAVSRPIRRINKKAKTFYTPREGRNL